MIARVRIALVLSTVAVAAVAVAVSGGSAHSVPRARAAAAPRRAYKATATWTLLNPNSTSGPTQGKGKFSASLGGLAALEARAVQAITGVPLASIAKGGSYAISFNFGKGGVETGTVAAKFKAHGLGEACAGFSARHGTYVPGSPFVPESGTLKSTGGKGSAAMWQITIGFNLKDITGMSIEQMAVSGKTKASVGKPRKPSAACKAVLKLLG
jgi:hypothetical protein